MDVLSVDISGGSPPVLHVRGEIDIATADQLRFALERALSSDETTIVDLKDVPFIDLSGLHVFLEAAAARNGHGPLRLVNAQRVARLLDILDLDGETSALQICDAP